GEVAPPAGLDSSDGQGDGEVGFAAAGLTEEQDRAVLFDEPQGGEVLDEFAVDGGLELEVEVVDGLVEREPGVAQPGGEAPIARRGGFFGDEACEELDVGPVVGAGVVGE